MICQAQQAEEPGRACPSCCASISCPSFSFAYTAQTAGPDVAAVDVSSCVTCTRLEKFSCCRTTALGERDQSSSLLRSDQILCIVELLSNCVRSLIAHALSPRIERRHSRAGVCQRRVRRTDISIHGAVFPTTAPLAADCLDSDSEF